MTSTYDPFAHAESLRLHVEFGDPGADKDGRWIPPHKLIVLRPNLGRIRERCVLAHEVAHAVLGHADDRPKHEVMANRAAAEWLLSEDELLGVLAWTQDTARICLELSVTSNMLRVYANVHRLTGFENPREQPRLEAFA